MVVIATHDGRAYYLATSLMKAVAIPFTTISPGNTVPASARLVITTKGERGLIDFDNILFIEDLSEGVHAKEKIVSQIYGSRKDELVLGIDPGRRIGFAAFYNKKEIDAGVVNSVDELMEKVSPMMEATRGRKVVKVGSGDPPVAGEIIERMVNFLGSRSEIEMVDEKGTSRAGNGFNKRGPRDLQSARMIALRNGKRISFPNP